MKSSYGNFSIRNTRESENVEFRNRRYFGYKAEKSIMARKAYLQRMVLPLRGIIYCNIETPLIFILKFWT